jgi:HSP20 family protein
MTRVIHRQALVTGREDVMALSRWDPIGEMMTLRQAIDRLFEESFVPPSGGRGQALGGVNRFPLDVAETDEGYVVRSSLPGVRPEDIEITAQGNTLTIRGECRPATAPEGHRVLVRECWAGEFSRSVTLPGPIDVNRAEARCENGILIVTLPKAESARPRRITLGGPTAGQTGRSIGATIEGSSRPVASERAGEDASRGAGRQSADAPEEVEAAIMAMPESTGAQSESPEQSSTQTVDAETTGDGAGESRRSGAASTQAPGEIGEAILATPAESESETAEPAGDEPKGRRSATKASGRSRQRSAKGAAGGSASSATSRTGSRTGSRSRTRSTSGSQTTAGNESGESGKSSA